MVFEKASLQQWKLPDVWGTQSPLYKLLFCLSSLLCFFICIDSCLVDLCTILHILFLQFVSCIIENFISVKFFSACQSALRRLQQNRQEAINEKVVLQGKIEEMKTSVWVVIKTRKIDTNHTCFLVKWNVLDMHFNLYWEPLILIYYILL